MSYNIESCKVKKIENFQIPLVAFQQGRKDWQPIIKVDPNDIEIVSIIGGCGTCIIQGKLKDKIVHVEKWNVSSDGSGHYFYEILRPALEKSTGYLEVINAWEGGEINRMTVIDGIISETEL